MSEMEMLRNIKGLIKGIVEKERKKKPQTREMKISTQKPPTNLFKFLTSSLDVVFWEALGVLPVGVPFFLLCSRTQQKKIPIYK
jgi:acetone carboxylase gamma subunit